LLTSARFSTSIKRFGWAVLNDPVQRPVGTRIRSVARRRRSPLAASSATCNRRNLAGAPSIPCRVLRYVAPFFAERLRSDIGSIERRVSSRGPSPASNRNPGYKPVRRPGGAQWRLLRRLRGNRSAPLGNVVRDRRRTRTRSGTRIRSEMGNAAGRRSSVRTTQVRAPPWRMIHRLRSRFLSAVRRRRGDFLTALGR
jgi:hypothetical protein